MRTNIILLFFIVLGCSSCSNSDIVPFKIQDKVEKYLCWPYDVKVYSIDNIKIDSLFYTYPLKSYFGENPRYEVVTWTKYYKMDTLSLDMKLTLGECHLNKELYNQLLKGKDIYYAGIYCYNEVSNEKKLEGMRKYCF